MADATMLTEAITRKTGRQLLDRVATCVRNLAHLFILTFSVFEIGASLLCLTSTLALAQVPEESQTQAQTRQKLLQDLDSGKIQDAIVLGQEAVSHWPR